MRKRRAGQRCAPLQLHAPPSPSLHTGAQMHAITFHVTSAAGTHSLLGACPNGKGVPVLKIAWTHIKAWLRSWCKDHSVHFDILGARRSSASLRHVRPAASS